MSAPVAFLILNTYLPPLFLFSLLLTASCFLCLPACACVHACWHSLFLLLVSWRCKVSYYILTKKGKKTQLKSHYCHKAIKSCYNFLCNYWLHLRNFFSSFLTLSGQLLSSFPHHWRLLILWWVLEKEWFALSKINRMEEITERLFLNRYVKIFAGLFFSCEILHEKESKDPVYAMAVPPYGKRGFEKNC